MLTLILCTYRNAGHLKRALTFYKKSFQKIFIIIADSSNEENKKKNRETIAEFFSDNFFLLHLEYSNTIRFSEKILLSVEHVTTKYCLIVGDDDFFSVHCIRKIIKNLEENKEYGFGSGALYGFIFNERHMKWYLSGQYDGQRSFLSNDPLKRLESYLCQYVTTFYSVFRTDILKEVVRNTYTFAPELVFFDNMFTMQALLHTKGLSINEPFWFKEMSHLSTSDTYNYQWYLGKGFEESKRLMEKGLAQTLSNIMGLSCQVADVKSKEYINLFMETTFFSMYPQHISQPFYRRAKRYVKACLPDALVAKLVFLKNKIQTKNADKKKFYLKNEYSAYGKEFKEIELIIKQSDIYCYRDGFENALEL